MAPKQEEEVILAKFRDTIQIEPTSDMSMFEQEEEIPESTDLEDLDIKESFSKKKKKKRLFKKDSIIALEANPKSKSQKVEYHGKPLQTALDGLIEPKYALFEMNKSGANMTSN
jgi:hypothetical protein